ncbi:MAG: hypothetical protein A3I24_03305 [Candidatus Harrisonbacteria bacterium RIFCSPLOWO2_02_FULL_41_13b]|uniref:Type II secretion system protein GspI C-terminal domain-containing protein n=1 Tax=Candidatus Harrisonbacteria bacterium RIFCSPLOWO2_02_FULL_41_13b TaxID=1798409 RepID=A0A1G1ZT32_9BACT|nr:MAG: hypothetical protein A3J53_02615 [Candidatus Harrisonbacteria bacterium RIFCSPHIGHO2_02_FULL_40_20]OGY67631.1 MAG: hypothetical protein A3I24_03305 [Candidatus Harrisonbacteria bacterium RIFCSPLOWO2_02_FULL_41_13b]
MKQLKFKIQNLKLRHGFTMIELLVAMGVFIIIVGVSIGIFVRSLRTQRNIINLMAINDNASLAIEQMTREIRTGQLFSSLGPSALKFLNYQGRDITYRWNTSAESLERGEGDIFKAITASEVKIKRLQFILSGEEDGDNIPTRVTVVLGVGSNQRDLTGVLNNIQTTISPRVNQ